ncbi:MAG: AzlC family ABC transporter permease [Rhizobiaceae bacterium]
MSVETTSERDAMRDFRQGARLGIPVIVASAPFGMLFGALAIQQGMSAFEVALMSATVYAGASQMVGIELFGQNLEPWVVVLSIFAVNFRHVLYSAAVGRNIVHWPLWQKVVGFFFLVDPQFAESERRAEAGLPLGFTWYMGMALPIYVMWILTGYVGALFGPLIKDPQALGLDFLLPIYFLGMVLDFRKRPLWLPVVAASAAASILAHYLVSSPWHVSIGAAVGIAVAAAMAPSASRPVEKDEAGMPGESV